MKDPASSGAESRAPAGLHSSSTPSGQLASILGTSPEERLLCTFRAALSVNGSYTMNIHHLRSLVLIFILTLLFKLFIASDFFLEHQAERGFVSGQLPQA